MDPVTGMVAIQAVSAIAQMYNAEKTRGAAKKKLKEIEALFDSIVPPDLVGSIASWRDDEMLPKFSSGEIPFPDFNINSAQYDQIKKFVPEIAPYVAQVKPELVSRSAVGEEGLAAQRKALSRYMDIAESDSDPAMEAMLRKASREGQIQAQSRSQSALQDFARRGQMGSGMQLASQLQGQESAMDRMASQGQDAAIEAYRNRLEALGQGAQLGGSMEGRDLDLSRMNTDTINRFNEMTSTKFQNYLNQSADTSNQAQKFNIGTAKDDRDRLDKISGMKYDADIAQQKKQNELEQLGFSNAFKKADVLNSQYQNELDKMKGKAGIATKGYDAGISEGQDAAKAIQGAANIGSTYFSESAKADDREQGREQWEKEFRARYPNA